MGTTLCNFCERPEQLIVQLSKYRQIVLCPGNLRYFHLSHSSGSSTLQELQYSAGLRSALYWALPMMHNTANQHSYPLDDPSSL